MRMDPNRFKNQNISKWYLFCDAFNGTRIPYEKTKSPYGFWIMAHFFEKKIQARLYKVGDGYGHTRRKKLYIFTVIWINKQTKTKKQ